MKVTLSLVRGNGHYYRYKPTDINSSSNSSVGLVMSWFPKRWGKRGWREENVDQDNTEVIDTMLVLQERVQMLISIVFSE